MSIRRGPRPETRFYTLDKSISEDERLSWGARGLLIFLLGKPDHWEVSVKHLISQTANAMGKASGRDAVRVILKELEQAGYLIADIARGEGGAFNGMAYTVCEIPGVISPETDNPAPAKPAPANPHLVSNEDKQGLKEQVKPIGDFGADAFDLFWKTSLKNGSKKKSLELFKAYCKRTDTEPLAFALILVNDTNARKKAKQYGFDKLHVTTYLSQERWNDNVPAAETGKPSAFPTDFAGKTYEGTANEAFADFLQDDKTDE